MKTLRTFPLFFILIICSCTSPTHNKEMETIAVTDDYGRTVEIPRKIEKVVSLSPAVTEIIYELNRQHLLCGRTEYCNYPPECKTIPSIGGISNLNIEAVIAKSPDIVIIGSIVSKKNVLQLEQMGIPVVCIKEKNDFEGLYENIAKTGVILNCKKEADSIIDILAETVKSFNASPSANTPTHSMYYVVGFGNSGNFTAGGNSHINDIIELSGGVNIASDNKGWSFSNEALLSADPNYIIVRQEDADAFCNMHPYNQLTAVQTGHVIPIESNIIDLQIPRNIDAIAIIRNFVENNPIQ